MKILMTGSTGLLGSSLAADLRSRGHELVRLSRPGSRRSGAFTWDPDAGILDLQALEGCDAVVHLAGENIASGRWTAERKRRILESRKRGTRLLAEATARARSAPSVFVSASATGYYGDRGDEILCEDSPPGKGFLAEVCREWEDAAAPAAGAARVVNLRIGIVLTTAGGALARMLPPFRMGAGGPLGSGNQYWSWISLEDVVGIVNHALSTPSLSGPVNTVAPSPLTNREFARVLGNVLSRPAVVPVPGFVLRAMLGEMADALLLSSARVEPAKLNNSGYRFVHPDLAGALAHALRG